MFSRELDKAALLATIDMDPYEMPKLVPKSIT